MNLSPGCALWRAAGGPLALSTEAVFVREHIYRSEMIAWGQGGSKGQPPQRIELPKPAHETRVQSDVMAAKVRAHMEREARRVPPPPS